MALNSEYKLTVEWSNTVIAPRFVNSFYFKQTSVDIGDSGPEDLMDRFIAEVGDNYAALVTSQLSVVRLAVIGWPDLELIEERTTLPILDGTLSGDPLPVRTCGILKYRTADFSRRGRGRVFLPPASEATNTLGQPTSGWNAAADTMAADLLAMDTGTGTYASFDWMLFSRSDASLKPVVTGGSGGYWGSRRTRRGIYV